MLLGDFNFPFLKWKQHDDIIIPCVQSGGKLDQQHQAECLLELTNNLFLEQTIINPTRNDNVLDLIFTNDENLINISEITDTAISDHRLITATLNINFNKNPKDETQPVSDSRLGNFSFWSDKSDWNAVNEYLSKIDWNNIMPSESDVKNDMETFYDTCYQACVNNIPTRKNTNNKSKIPHDRKVLMRKRRLLHIRLKKVKTKSKRNKINKSVSEIELQLIESHTNERIRNEHKVVSAVKVNTKAFFKYAKQADNKKPDIGPLLNSNGELVNDPKEKSNILKQQYEKVFNTKKADIEITLNPTGNENQIPISDFFNENNSPFSEIQISESDIKQAIEETKINSAPGLDGLPPVFLHKCKLNILKPLTVIMNKSIQSGEIPEVWKEASITPIFKGGKKEEPANYRPVSLTSQIAKLLERIIRWYLVTYLELINAFPDSQHGFRAFRSTVSQLLQHYDDIVSALEEKSNIDVIMLDFSKAFDTIDISILLKKMKKLGIGGPIARWIGNFLLERKQKVVVNKHSSEWSEVKSGVPQGTILAPLLFLIYIADIGDDVIDSILASYADDSKLRKKIKSEQDGEKLQSDLNTVFRWTDTNLMKFNLSKFEILRIGKQQHLKENIKYTTPQNENIPESDTVKDLGVIFNSEGNFEDHIKLKVAKANRMCGYILRTFMIRDPGPMMCLFRTLVIPIIDYCSIVWNPSKRKFINLIEKVQRNFTKRLTNMKEKTYYERLQELNIYSMERRRERYEVLYTFKLLKSLVPNIGIKPKWSQRRGRMLVPPAVHKNSTQAAATMRRNSFRAKAAFLFNALPDHLRNISLNTSMDKIKRDLDKLLQTVTDEPMLAGYTRSNDSPSNSLVHQLVRCRALDP